MIPERLADTELRQLALDHAEGKLYITNSAEGMRAFQVVLWFMEEVPREEAEQWGAIYEYLDKALPRTINGMPMFSSFKVLHVDNLLPFLKLVEEAMQHRDQFVGGGT